MSNLKQIVWCLFMALYILNIVLLPFMVGKWRDPYTPATATRGEIISILCLAGLWILRP